MKLIDVLTNMGMKMISLCVMASYYDVIMHNVNARVLKQMKINKLHGLMSSFMPKHLLSSSFFCRPQLVG